MKMINDIYDQTYLISMKKILFRKFLIDNIIFLTISLVSSSIIIWIFQAVNFLDIIIEDGRSYNVYISYSLLNLPKIISRIFPFAVFFSFYYVLIRYEINNELIIFWNFGINKINLVRVVFFFSIVLLIFQIMLSVLLVPKTQDMARTLLRSSSINLVEDFIKEKKFNDLIRGLTIHAENKDNNGNLKNIYLKDTIDNENFNLTIAKNGKITKLDNITYLILYDGENITANKDEITNFSFSQSTINLTKFESNIMKTIKTQESSTKDLINCYFRLKKNKLFNEINFDKNFFIENCSLENLKVILRELYKRFIIPIYIPVLVLISLLLIFSSKEKKNYLSHRIFIFLCGFVLIILSEGSLRYIKGNFGGNFGGNFILICIPFIFSIILYSLFNLKFNKKKFRY